MERNALLFAAAGLMLALAGCDAVGSKADATSPDTAVCNPVCEGRECGPDGCGGTCGDCGVGSVCETSTGTCSNCQPSCWNRECGDDGCGGTCGTCPVGESCNPLSRKCIAECTRDCTGKECGDDGCGGSCGPCSGSDVCLDGACTSGSTDVIEPSDPGPGNDVPSSPDLPDPSDAHDPSDAPDTDTTGPVANAIAPIQQSNISVKCPPEGTTETPAFVNGATGLALDVVVVSPRYVVSKDKSYGYIVADAGLTRSEAWRGIAIKVPVEVTSDEWVPGDALTLTVDHVEYYCFTQVAVTAATRTGTLPIPAPVDIDPADLGSQDEARAEKYEGVLVRVRNVAVISTPALGTDGKDHGSFLADDDLIVANDFRVPYMATETDARRVGDRFDSIVGVVKYSFNQYILVPRTGADMVLAGTQPGDNAPEPTGDLPVPQDIVETRDAFEAVDVPTEHVGPVADSISVIQQSDVGVKCPPDGTTQSPAFVNGAVGLTLDVVVVSPRYVVTKDKKYGYFVADAGLSRSEAWRGIAITVPVEVTTDEWVPGDALTLTVDHVEYYCFSQVTVTAATWKGTLPVPAPVDIDPADLGSQDGSLAEKYEGVLVRVRDVTVVTTPAVGTDGKDHGSFLADDGLIVANDFRVPYMSIGTDARTVGDRFDSIVGVVKYSYDQYILVPRTGDDMILAGTQPGDNAPEPTGDLPVPRDIIETVDVSTDTGADPSGDATLPPGVTLLEIQSDQASTGCTEATIANLQVGLSLAPVVVVSPKFVASAGKLDGYYVSDTGVSTAAPFAGAMVVADVGLATAFQPGDVLTVTGDWIEYYCLTEIKATDVRKSGSAAIPQPRVVAPSELATQNAATSEPLEGVLVELQNVTVTDANPDAAAGKDFGSFAVANGVIIANTFKLNYMNNATDQRTVGDTFSRIVGVVSYSFGKYVVLPRSNDDLVLGPR